MRKIISLIVTCVMVLGISSQLISCKNIKYVKIKTVEEFIQYTQEDPYEKKSGRKILVYKLMADLDFSGINYEPTNLKADFDGNGHTLSNITINEYSDTKPVGVFSSNYKNKNSKNFAYEISNLNVTNLTINFSGQKAYVGGLVGEVLWSQFVPAIKNVSVQGKVNAPQTSYVGGIVGRLHRDFSYSFDISNCKANVDVVGKNYVGGIIGAVVCKVDNSNKSTIRTCSSSGSIKGNDYVGGVAGVCEVVFDCNNNASVEGANYVGGIAGYVQEKIDASHNQGNVIGTKGIEDKSYIGGVVGYCNAGKEIKMENLTNSGNVNGGGASKVGGICGFARTDCTQFSNTGNVAGSNYVGGIIGYMELSSEGKEQTLLACVNGGSVSAYSCAGGLVGMAIGGSMVTIINCSVSSTVGAYSEVNEFICGAVPDFDYLDTNTFTGEIINYSGQS